MEQPHTRETDREDTTAVGRDPETRTHASRTSHRPFWARPWVWVGLIVIVLAGGTAVLAQTGTISLPALGGGNNTNNTEDGAVVATVNDEEITNAELDDRIAQLRQNLTSQGQSVDTEQESQLRQQALTNLVNERLVLQEAQAQDISVTDTQISQAFEQIKGRFENEQAFQDELSGNGISEDQLRDRIERELIVQQYLAENVDQDSIEISDEAVQSAYDRISGQQENVPPLADIREQLVAQLEQQETQTLVQQLIQQLRETADIQTNL